eukprot:7876710-Alexandrium_andersonii.AAC.1
MGRRPSGGSPERAMNILFGGVWPPSRAFAAVGRRPVLWLTSNSGGTGGSSAEGLQRFQRVPA